MKKPYVCPEIEIHHFTMEQLIVMVQPETNESPEQEMVLVPGERWLDGIR